MTSAGSAEDAPNTCSSNIVDNIGCIEVIVVRCKSARIPFNMGYDGPSDDQPPEYSRRSTGSRFDDRDLWRTIDPRGYGMQYDNNHNPHSRSTAANAFGGYPVMPPGWPHRPSAHDTRALPERHAPAAHSQPLYSHNGTIPPVTFMNGWPRSSPQQNRTTPPGPAQHVTSPGLGRSSGSPASPSAARRFGDQTPSEVSVEVPTADPNWLQEVVKKAYQRGVREARQMEENDRRRHPSNNAHGVNHGVQPHGNFFQPAPPLHPIDNRHSSRWSLGNLNSESKNTRVPHNPIPGSWPREDNNSFNARESDVAHNGDDKKDGSANVWLNSESTSNQASKAPTKTQPPLEDPANKAYTVFNTSWGNGGGNWTDLGSRRESSESSMVSPTTTVKPSDNHQPRESAQRYLSGDHATSSFAFGDPSQTWGCGDINDARDFKRAPKSSLVNADGSPTPGETGGCWAPASHGQRQKKALRARVLGAPNPYPHHMNIVPPSPFGGTEASISRKASRDFEANPSKSRNESLERTFPHSQWGNYAGLEIRKATVEDASPSWQKNTGDDSLSKDSSVNQADQNKSSEQEATNGWTRDPPPPTTMPGSWGVETKDPQAETQKSQEEAVNPFAGTDSKDDKKDQGDEKKPNGGTSDTKNDETSGSSIPAVNANVSNDAGSQEKVSSGEAAKPEQTAPVTSTPITSDPLTPADKQDTSKDNTEKNTTETSNNTTSTNNVEATRWVDDNFQSDRDSNNVQSSWDSNTKDTDNGTSQNQQNNDNSANNNDNGTTEPSWDNSAPEVSWGNVDPVDNTGNEAGQHEASGFGGTGGNENVDAIDDDQKSSHSKKSSKPASNSSKYRKRPDLTIPNTTPKSYWVFPRSEPPRKLDAIPEHHESYPTKETLYKNWEVPAVPSLTVPSSLVERTGLEHHVPAGKGTKYMHLIGRPEYIDDLQRPYAVFRFKYRTRDFLKKQFGNDNIPDAEPTEDGESSQPNGNFHGLSREDIVEAWKLKEKIAKLEVEKY